MSPTFDFTRRLWFDRGGVYVVANIRGGGEFGEEWHKAGNLTNKQNVFDDFAAAAQYLDRDRSTPAPTSWRSEGGSNGGLLMGAMITQHPDLMRAVVSAVGIYDMLRVELAPNGGLQRHRVRHGERTPSSSRRSTPTRPIITSSTARSIPRS